MISIIGSGMVGSAIAFLAASNSLDDILLVNRTRSKATGEAMDIANAIPEGSEISVRGTDDYTETGSSHTVVIAASTGTYTKSRTELASAQVGMARQIIAGLGSASGPRILVVSNPVDVLTHVFQEEGGYPRGRVVGIASSLDSSRLRLLLAGEMSVNQSRITGALVLGEHGDSMVPVFSRAKKDHMPVLDSLGSAQTGEITRRLRSYWRALREHKSRSVFGISRHVYDVLASTAGGGQMILPASVPLDGQYGITGVCIGVPARISARGLEEILEVDLSGEELAALRDSAARVRRNTAGALAEAP